jgi:hypothetical protein
MYERNGVPLLAVGSKDGTGVVLVSASLANVVPAEQRRLGGAWETETAYREALHLAAQAIDKLVADAASRRKLATKPEPVVNHLTKVELEEEAHFHGYELVAPGALESLADKIEEWKEIAVSKERELAELKASERREKRQRMTNDVAETPRQAAPMTPDLSKLDMLEVIEKKLDKILETQHKDSKRIKKVKKQVKYNHRY